MEQQFEETKKRFKEKGVPEIIGPLEDGCFLDNGGFGDIYKSKWNHRDVAVKKYHTIRDDIQGEDIYKDQRREILELHECRHKHIVQLLGYMEDPPRLMFDVVLEYANNNSLSVLLCDNSPGTYSKARAMDWCIQLADAIQFLHGKTKIHRDIKPDNILLFDDYATAKLGDFGTVRSIDTNMTSITGTAMWRAPEMGLSGDYTQAADIYSFTISMWQIFAQKIDYINKKIGDVEIMTLVKSGNRPQTNTIGAPDPEVKKYFTTAITLPDELRNLLECGWAHDPTTRPSARDLYESLKIIRDKMGSQVECCMFNRNIYSTDLQSLEWGDFETTAMSIPLSENNVDFDKDTVMNTVMFKKSR